MAKSKTEKPNNRKRLTRRAALLLGAQFGVMGVLALRMRKLGIEESESFRLLAEENRINVRLVPPLRGVIFDRRGTPIAINTLSYQIEMVREQTEDPAATLTKLSEIVPISAHDMETALAEMNARRGFVPVTVASDLAWEHVAAVSANAPALPGITAQRGFKRSYPKGNDFAHVVGYVGPVSDFDLSKIEDPDPLLMIPKFLIGKNGIEARTDTALRGAAGYRKIEVNAVGRIMRELELNQGDPGSDLQLTLDARVQKRTIEILSKQPSASAVVMDVTSGDIIASASVPTFDPNKFVNGISSSDWNGLNTNKYRPLLNKTVSGQYPPGSTFKMLVALAALEHNVVGASERVFCPGHLQEGNQRFHCWKRGGHGSVNLTEAVRYSCDVYFYDVAKRVGIDRIAETAKKFGLGIRHDVPLPAVYSGIIPSIDWKRERYDQSWRVGDTLNAGIGQGYVLTTPLQLAVMTARFATGKAVKPNYIHAGLGARDQRPAAEALDVRPEHLRLIQQSMFEVSNHPRGTAYRYRPQNADYQIAGKTGTSQVRRITMEERARGVFKNSDLPWERRDHGLFVCYAPFDNPKYAVSVIVEHGGGSGSAAPLARDIIDYVMTLDDLRYLPPLKGRASLSTDEV